MPGRGPSSLSSLCAPAAHTAFIGREDSDRDHGTEEGAGLGSKGRVERCRQERWHLLRRPPGWWPFRLDVHVSLSHLNFFRGSSLP